MTWLLCNAKAPAALRHPDIAEVAVIGVPAAFGEDDIKVCASLKSGCVLEPAALRTHLKGELAAHQMPRYIEIRAQFPRTDTEKIRKAALRDEGASGLTSTTWDADTGTLWTKGR
jgi:crotonobetaine/carnitine-CoA ligase